MGENLKRHGFEIPTPIQAAAIPAVMKGHDVVGLAQTGTGKTAAFVLPMLHKLSTGPRKHVRALIIGPTRELAEQINEVVHQLGRGTELHTALIYGGMSYRPQFESIRRGAEIVVACPGRLLDHIQQRTINLSQVEILVLDEADQMFDMGFLPAIKQILRSLPTNKQVLLFSATMPPEIRKLAQHILRNPEEIKVGHSAPIETVSHAIFPVSQNLKPDLVIELLRRTDTGPVLIFTRTRHRTKKLDRVLNAAGFKAASIQGDLSQNRRKEAMDGFRSGKYQILVATDVAARGIDVSGISHVINFDIPDTVEAYTHRIGRTGRAAKTGDAFTLVTQEDADTVRQIERVLKSQIERRYLDGFNYKAQPAHAPKPPPGMRGGRNDRGGGHGLRNEHRGPARQTFQSAHRDAAPVAHHAAPGARPPQHAHVRSDQPRPEIRRDDRPPRQEHSSRRDQHQRPFHDRPAGAPNFPERPFDSRDRDDAPRKDRRDIEPTMTGAPRYQGNKPKPKSRPFWQRISR